MVVRVWYLVLGGLSLTGVLGGAAQCDKETTGTLNDKPSTSSGSKGGETVTANNQFPYPYLSTTMWLLLTVFTALLVVVLVVWRYLRTRSKREFIVPHTLRKGDKVAVLAPSGGAAAVFPWRREQGVERLKERFGLNPILYPTMYETSPTVEDRAKDLNDAFADPDIKGIICSIGGDDMVRVLPFLDLKVLKKNPKCVLGFSDITSLHLLLWQNGIVSYYGGALMTQFAISGKDMQEFTALSIENAVMNRTPTTRLCASTEFVDGYYDWSQKASLLKEPKIEQNDGWIWHNSGDSRSSIISGRLWGGCLSVLFTHFVVKRYLPTFQDLNGAILFFETSETMPSSCNVYQFLSSLGEIGLLQKFAAVLVGRPKTQDRGLTPPIGREQYKLDQRAATIRALSEYCKEMPIVVFNMDFGHTDPQTLVPSGGLCQIDVDNKTIDFNYTK